MLTDPHGTNELTRRIIGCAIRVHSAIGPGALESVYQECMTHELREEKLTFESGRVVPLVYRGIKLKARFYIDLVVENTVAVELKAIETLAQVHTRVSGISCVGHTMRSDYAPTPQNPDA